MSANPSALIGLRPIGTATVERLWGTPAAVDAIDLSSILLPGVTPPEPAGPPFELIDPASVLADEAALRAEMLESMTALAQGQGLPVPAGLQLQVEVWRGGYDRPAFSVGADAIAWCVLAASTPRNQESGAIALTDPRPGGPQTAMPGLPWGRQLILRCTPGAHAAAPGWLTCSLVPVEQGQSALVAVAISLR